MIHLHSAATAQQTCNINFSVVFVFLPSRPEQVLTCTFMAPEAHGHRHCAVWILLQMGVLFLCFFFFFSLLSCKSVRYTLYTPTQNILALVCAGAVNSWTCMCRECAPSVYFLRGRVSAREHIHTCISPCQASHELCSDRSHAADGPGVCQAHDLQLDVALTSAHCQLFSPNSLMSPQCLHRLNQCVRLCNLHGDLFLLIFTYHRRPGGMQAKSPFRGKKCNSTVNLTF